VHRTGTRRLARRKVDVALCAGEADRGFVEVAV